MKLQHLRHFRLTLHMNIIRNHLWIWYVKSAILLVTSTFNRNSSHVKFCLFCLWFRTVITPALHHSQAPLFLSYPRLIRNTLTRILHLKTRTNRLYSPLSGGLLGRNKATLLFFHCKKKNPLKLFFSVPVATWALQCLDTQGWGKGHGKSMLFE